LDALKRALPWIRDRVQGDIDSDLRGACEPEAQDPMDIVSSPARNKRSYDAISSDIEEKAEKEVKEEIVQDSGNVNRPPKRARTDHSSSTAPDPVPPPAPPQQMTSPPGKLFKKKPGKSGGKG
jgi:hypothetical protein